jgi:PKD repeat protein
VAIDHSTDTVEVAASVTAVAGVVVTYAWDFGDGASASTAAAAHVYSDASNRTVAVTATGTGDGVTYAATTSSGSCSKVVDFVTGTGGVAGSSGGSDASPGAPVSCGWTDVLCDVEAAVAWLFVPDHSFYSEWDGFLGSMESHVPFSYVGQAASWVGRFVTAVNVSDDTSTPTCPTVGRFSMWDTGGCGNSGSGGTTMDVAVSVFRGLVGLVVVSGTIAGVWVESRRIIGQH